MRRDGAKTRIRLGVRGIEEAAGNDDTIIIIDVLRASSTIITAIDNGALGIVPTSTVTKAKRFSSAIPNSVLGGERRGLRIPGFRFGNSPLEYTTQSVRDKHIVFTTTNCTKLLERCKKLPSAEAVLIGAFLNASATARTARRYSVTQNKGITIVQAGSGGKPSLDDLVCAELLKTIIETGVRQQATPRVRDIVESLLYTVLSNTKHGRYLTQIGFDSDLRYCSRLDTTNLVPQLIRKQGMIPTIVRVADSDQK